MNIEVHRVADIKTRNRMLTLDDGEDFWITEITFKADGRMHVISLYTNEPDAKIEGRE